MDMSGRTGGSTATASSRGGWRIWPRWARTGASLVVLASALSGCASLAMEKALGPNPQLYPPVVEGYEWAGRRGDELVIVYRVWGGHPRRHELRWTAIDLGRVAWAEGLGAPRVGNLEDRTDPVPDIGATAPVPVVPLMGGPLEQEVALAHHRGHVAAAAPLAVYGRAGSAPGLIVVTCDASGQLRSASWALRPTEDPGRAESVPRQLARGAAGAVDVGTAPLQWLLVLLGVMRIH